MMEKMADCLFESIRLRHERLDNGIHVFTFHEASRDALDDWFQQLHGLWAGYPPENKPIAMLIDSSACGTQPLGYAYRQATKFYAGFDYRPVVYTAFVERSLIMVRVLDAFLHMLHSEPHTHYFTAGQQDDALAWLASLPR
jgi:hypothetical protein